MTARDGSPGAAPARANRAGEVVRSLHAFTRCLSAARRWQLLGLLGLMFLAALAEMASLGMLLPFLALLADPAHALARFPRIAALSAGIEPARLMWVVTVAFAVFAVLAAVIRMALNVGTARVNFGIAHELGVEIYRRALYRPYAYHVRHHSTETVGAVTKIDVVAVVILAVLIGISSAFMAVCLAAVILAVDPVIALVAVLGFGGSYALISRLSRRQLTANGHAVNVTSNTRLKALQEGLGGIRDVILDHTQAFHLTRFGRYDAELRAAQSSNQIIGPSPRFAIEAVGMIAIAVLGYLAAGRPGGVASALPTLGVLVLGAQRLLPMMQQVFVGWTLAVGHRDVIDDITGLMMSPLPDHATGPAQAPIEFRKAIELRGLGFRYEGADRATLEDVTCRIPHGARVGIIGATGSGKTTLLNLLMGLVEPTQGEILVDGQPIRGASREAWQRRIAHVPQNIFLADARVAENVAFGIDADQVDPARVARALEDAQMLEAVRAMPRGVDTYIGEGGVRLSGGQRQRLGIARALYKDPAVLILDEATSALDTATEAGVMQTIRGLRDDMTLVMIAHRLSTLRQCNMLLCVHEGRVDIITEPERIAARLGEQSDVEETEHESQ
jgi:ATP-binding cassette subfamily B protein